MAFRDAQLLNSNAGYLQAFCNAFATICEKCNEDDCKQVANIWFERALSSIDKAIMLDPQYAKFYCTKGRILALGGRYTEAIALINQAISKEDSSRSDYALTIAGYQYYKLQIQMRQQRDELQNQISQLQKALSVLNLNTSISPSTKVLDEKAVCKPYTGKEPFVFVSYAHKDKNDVFPLIKCLQDNQVHVWYDEGIIGGTEWPEEVATNLMKSRTVIVMLSNQSVQSANVRREVNLALAEGRNLVVVQLDEVSLSPGMRLQFGLYQMIDRTRYAQEEFISKLLVAMKRGTGYDN